MCVGQGCCIHMNEGRINESQSEKQRVDRRDVVSPIAANQYRFFPLTFILAADGISRTSCVIPKAGAESKTSCTWHWGQCRQGVHYTRRASRVRRAMDGAAVVLVSLLLLTAVSAGSAGETTDVHGVRGFSVTP
jgi:hypothetical protein